MRWPAFARTQVPSVQPESRRGRFRGTVESSRSTVRRMDGSTGVWILGGYQTDFAGYLTKGGRDFAALTACFTPGEHLAIAHVGLSTARGL